MESKEGVFRSTTKQSHESFDCLLILLDELANGHNSHTKNGKRLLRCILDFERSRNQRQGSEFFIGERNP